MYDRTLYTPMEDSVTVNGEIILLEGTIYCYEDGWKSLKQYANKTIFVATEETLLRERVIA